MIGMKPARRIRGFIPPDAAVPAFFVSRAASARSQHIARDAERTFCGRLLARMSPGDGLPLCSDCAAKRR
jgi:hypothetical protein